MSIGKRAYNIMRGYVNREWERIQDLDRVYAEKELQDSMDKPAAANEAVSEAEIDAKVQQLADQNDPKTRARQLLGVGPNATFDEIRKAFDRLNKRSEPNKFPAGSAEATQAASIQQRINWAYQVLTENVDVTEKRFKSLEID